MTAPDPRPVPQQLLDIAAARFFGAEPGEPMAVSLEAAVTEVLAAAETTLYADLVKQHMDHQLPIQEAAIRARIASDIEAARPLDTGCTENVLIASGLATAARIARSER